MDFIYAGSICSDLDLIKGFVDNVLNQLNKIIDNKDTIFDIRLIINELIINGVFHGNHCLDTKCVNLEISILNKKITIDVRDEGAGIDFDLKSYNPLDLSFGGRGLILVEGLSDELIIKENRVTAIKYFD